jgi:tubulin polyglutamylase TTLL6/13
MQKINHFCGMLELCRKKSMASHMSQMAARLPQLYTFMPMTFQLPEDWADFQAEIKTGRRGRCWIIKPDSGCQGRGIFLVQTRKQAAKVSKARMRPVFSTSNCGPDFTWIGGKYVLHAHDSCFHQ